VPDCSSVFMGGIVAYNNEIKRRLLGVHSDTLKIHGAVSKETAMEMINGLKFHFDTHLSISITGIAGPNGGTITKPVGTIFVCYKYIDHIEAEKLFFSGTREEIQEQVCNHSVEKLIEMLKGVEK
jgi:PncC family amidohydrolase